jgi:hypothetical protein
MSISQSELVRIQHDLAKECAGLGAYIIKVKIDDKWVDKCFMRRCPGCEARLPKTLKAWGVEKCSDRECGYERRLFTREEWLAYLKR